MNNYQESILNWLRSRKINDVTISQFGIQCENKVTIPVRDENGVFLFNKYRRNPFGPDDGPKYWYDPGTHTELFGLEFIKDKKSVVICEGELDALVLWSHNIPAVSSTGGAMSFQEKWVPHFADKEVFICFDNDQAGAQGMVKTLFLIPHAKIIILPDSAGIKDITDYYIKGGDLRDLMESAKHYVSYETVHEELCARRASFQSFSFHEEWEREWEKREVESGHKKKKINKQEINNIERAKQVPIDSIIKVSRAGKALCPFHNEDTPSLHVYKDNHAYCFACNKRADVIEIARALNNLGFKEAVEWLNKQ